MLSGGLALAAAAQEVGMTNRWEFVLPDYGTECSPALAADGTIYEGTFHGWLLAFTPEGKLKWKFKAGREIKSSPAVAADGTIYFGARDRKCYAVTPAGKLKWTFPTGAWVDSSPAIAADGTVYFGSWDATFYALNPDGQLKWKFATGGIVDASPAIGADGTIYFGAHDKNFYALTPDGKRKWQFATGAEITASPAIAADGTIYFSSTDGNCYALNPDGTKRWQQHTGGYTSSSPVLDEQGNLSLAVNQEQYSLDPSGKVRWHFNSQPPAIPVSGAALANGSVILSTPWARGMAVTPDMKMLWDFYTGAYSISGSPNVGPRGDIYVTDGRKLFVIHPLKNVAGQMRLESTGPASSSWPLWRGNPQHTGRVEIR